MLGFATTVARKAMRATFISLLSALLLQGCGGGGTNDDPTARTQQAEEARLASLASHYIVSEVGVDDYDWMGASTSKPRLLVIDTRTNSIVFQVDLKGEEAPHYASRPQWTATYSQQRHADQLGTDALGVSQLLYIQDGQVMQLDLSGDALGAPRRLSTMMVCRFGWSPFQFDTLGQTSTWLPVSLPAEGGDCNDPATQTHRFLRLDAAPGDTGVAVSETLVAHLRNADGSSLGFLALDYGSEKPKLVLLSPTDLRTRLQTLDLGNVEPVSAWRISLLGSAFAADPQQSLIQIGQVVHKIDWRSGELRLGAPILTMHESHPVITEDKFITYLADGCVIYRIDASGIPRILTAVPGDAGRVGFMMATGEHLLVSQNNWGNAPPGATPVPHGCVGSPPSGSYTTKLRVVNPLTGMTTQLLPDDQPYGQLLGHASGQVYVSAYQEGGGSDITRHDLNSGAKTVIAQHVELLSSNISPRHIRFGPDIARHQLLWCQISSEQGYSCGEGDELISYTIATGRSVTLGKMPAFHKYTAPVELADYSVNGYFYGWEDFFGGNPGVMMLSVGFSTPERNVYLTVPWMVTPGVANSLREIPYTVGSSRVDLQACKLEYSIVSPK